MNPIMQKVLGSVVRHMLALTIPFLVSQGIWTTDQATATMTSIAAALTVLLMSLYEKYSSQKKLVTALAMPKGTTQKDVEVQIATGQTPPVSLPKDIAPKVTH